MSRPKGSKNKISSDTVTEVPVDNDDSINLEEEGYQVEFDIVGLTPLGFGRPMKTTVEDLGGKTKENQEKLEKEYFRERIPIIPENGNACINTDAFKKALIETGKRVTYKRMATYAKLIKTNIDVVSNIDLGIKPSDIEGEEMYVPLPNNPGSRGWKTFPRIPKGWKAHIQLYVADKTITSNVLRQIISKAGLINGLGLFRPQSNGGGWGKFKVENWK